MTPCKSAGLTSAQRQALELMARGMTARQAALLLGVQPQTIKNCLAEARRALGAPNTLAAVLLAWRRGWISLPELADIETSHEWIEQHE